MKQFLAFVRKEFLHILRDRRTILILIGMPIVQIILFGFAISTEVKDVKTVVVTHSPDVWMMPQMWNRQNFRNQLLRLMEVFAE